MLTRENWKNGFLMDEEWMAGVSEEPARNGAREPAYAAFVLSQATGSCVGYHIFDNLKNALESVNAIPRAWKFESSSECGGCGHDDGGCGKGACRQACQTTGICELES